MAAAPPANMAERERERERLREREHAAIAQLAPAALPVYEEAIAAERALRAAAIETKNALDAIVRAQAAANAAAPDDFAPWAALLAATRAGDESKAKLNELHVTYDTAVNAIGTAVKKALQNRRGGRRKSRRSKHSKRSTRKSKRRY